MKKVIFLIGAPASGKSTWRDAYMAHAQRPTYIASTDDLIEEYASQRGLTYSEAFKEAPLNQFEKTVLQNFKDAMARGDDVIVDRTNMNPKSRNKFLQWVSKDYEKRAVIFQVPREELNQRLVDRAKKTGKTIGSHIIDSMLNSYIEPTLNEFDKIERI